MLGEPCQRRRANEPMTHPSPLVRARRLLLVCQLVALCLWTTIAGPAWAGDRAAAESLFQDGKAALKQGRYEHACGLFSASFDADPSVGALLNLARCHQKLGKTASAWAVFNDAAALAVRSGQLEREAGARKYAAKLEPQLSRLTIFVESPPDGLEVTRHGDPGVASSWRLPRPAVPGYHEIVAAAPGYETWTTTITVGAQADRQTISIPALQPRAGASPDASEGGGPSGMLVGGIAVTAVGVIALGAGIALGVVGMDETKALEDDCGGRSTCTGDWEERRDDIQVKADLSTAGFVIGSVALIGGVVLLLLSPSSETNADPGDAAAALTPWVGPENTGLVLTGRF